MPRHAVRHTTSRALTGAIALAAIVATASSVRAGPDCPEGGTDAGSGRSTAKTCSGVGPLGTITGALSAAAARVPDHEDMFLIQITDPACFVARTDGAAAGFDTQLWLFRLGGIATEAFGVLGNDDIALPPSNASRIQQPATDGTGQLIPGAGLYLLAISGSNPGADNDPVSAGGAIFNQAVATEISGPDGAGGAQAHTGGWSGGVANGTYRIDLACAALVPPPVGAPAMNPATALILGGLLFAAALAVFRRRPRPA